MRWTAGLWLVDLLSINANAEDQGPLSQCERCLATAQGRLTIIFEECIPAWLDSSRRYGMCLKKHRLRSLGLRQLLAQAGQPVEDVGIRKSLHVTITLARGRRALLNLKKSARRPRDYSAGRSSPRANNLRTPAMPDQHAFEPTASNTPPSPSNDLPPRVSTETQASTDTSEATDESEAASEHESSHASTSDTASASEAGNVHDAVDDADDFLHDAHLWRQLAREETRKNTDRLFRSSGFHGARPSTHSNAASSRPPSTHPTGNGSPTPSRTSHTTDSSSSSTTTSTTSTTSTNTSTASPLGRLRRWSRSTLGVDGREVTSWWPHLRQTYDPARKLGPKDVRNQRLVFFAIVFVVNAAALIAALLSTKHAWVFAFIIFVKSADCIKSIWSAIALVARAGYRLVFPLQPVSSKWILTLIPAYSESEEQIVKTVFSLRENDVEPHKQVMLVILDGRSRDIRAHMTLVIKSFRHEYTTSKHKLGELKIDVGFMEDVPIMVIEKVTNAGKKDSLILCHDLFNAPRKNLPFLTMHLREMLWMEILPMLTASTDFTHFDMIFCTDADSTIFKGAVAALANALARDPDAIASCGLLFVELEPGQEWSLLTLYQMFQYSFGQFVRRQAEGLWGKVTCLPGCITMIAVRPEMAEAIRMYAEPILAYPVIFHQVQYLGTDRRLTFQMLNQGKKLRTLFVPAALSETAAPQTAKHYLSQRRRWGSNAYYNDYFYAFGRNMIPITRAMALIDVIRLTMVYYRIANTVLFIYGLVTAFHVMKLIPLIVVSQIPTMWFAVNTVAQPELRKRWVRLLLGYVVNKFLSPVISVTVFTTVVKNLGSQVWGLTGITQASAGTGDDAVGVGGATSLGDRHEADAVAEHLGGNYGPERLRGSEAEKMRRGSQFDALEAGGYYPRELGEDQDDEVSDEWFPGEIGRGRHRTSEEENEYDEKLAVGGDWGDDADPF